MAFIPAILVIAGIFVRTILESLFQVSSSSLSTAVPGYMSPYTTGVINQYSASITGATTISILVIAPVGIFFFFIVIGWAMRLTEIWTSTLLTLGLSAITAIIMIAIAGSPPAPGDYLFCYLQWVAFLVQPFCIVAAGIVIFGTEKFRQSIEYRITDKGLWIRGGIMGVQEHMIPHNHVGRIVFEQDYFGTLYNYGTLIPHSSTRWGAETSFRGIGASGQKDNLGVGLGFAKGREEGSRHPLDCLFGIPDPKKVQKVLSEFICRNDVRQEEQVTYLKKIYELSVAGAGIRNEPAFQVPESTVVTRCTSDDDLRGMPVCDAKPDGKKMVGSGSPITRINDIDTLDTTSVFVSATERDILPLAKNRSATTQAAQNSESPLDHIRKLAELRDAGIITEDEFMTKKTELLKRL